MRQWLAHHEDLSPRDQFMLHDAAYLVAAMKGAPAPLIVVSKIIKQMIIRAANSLGKHSSDNGLALDRRYKINRPIFDLSYI